MSKEPIRSLSKCELVIYIDGNKLRLPINFGMSDDEMRAIYPYLLTLAKPEANPMIRYLESKKAGKFDNLSEAEKSDYINWTRRLARYWYDKPTTSLLDVAIGLAIDIKLNGYIPSLSDECEPADEGEEILNRNCGDITEEEVTETIGKYDPEILDIEEEDREERAAAGSLNIDMYGSESYGDFISEELDKAETANRARMISDMVNSGASRLQERLKQDKSVAHKPDITTDTNGLINMYNVEPPKEQAYPPVGSDLQPVESRIAAPVGKEESSSEPSWLSDDTPEETYESDYSDDGPDFEDDIEAVPFGASDDEDF